MIRSAPAALAVSAAILLSGCGALGGARHAIPATASATSSASAAVAATRRTHELPTPVPRSATRVRGGWPTPAAAVRGFAETYVNWTAPTVAARLRALAAASLGQARAELAAEAGEVARDRELRAGGVGNAGVVETLGPVAGRADVWAVVTRERTTATRSDAYRGLGAEWHVSLATVARTRDGLWVLSGWQPEN